MASIADTEDQDELPTTPDISAIGPVFAARLNCNAAPSLAPGNRCPGRSLFAGAASVAEAGAKGPSKTAMQAAAANSKNKPRFVIERASSIHAIRRP
jgi:hypothetical protein